MNFLSRTLTGGIMVVGGLGLIILAFFSSFWVLIHGGALIILGIFILFNKKEDKIEQIKRKGGTKK